MRWLGRAASSRSSRSSARTPRARRSCSARPVASASAAVALGTGGRVEGGHRRAHPRVEQRREDPQVAPHRLRRRPRPGARDRVAVGERGLGEDVLDPREHPGQHRVGVVEVGARRAPRLGEPRLDVGERGDVEEPLEHLTAVLRGRAEERCELALGEEHHLGELGHAHAEGVTDDVGDLVVPGAEAHPPGAAPLLERDHRLHLRPPRAPPLGTLELRGAADPEPPAPGGEVERDPWHGIRCGVVAAQAALGARAGHVGVQREADGVEQAGLARPRGTVDEEQPLGRQGVDVDDDAVGERPERLDLEPVDPHAAPTDPSASGAAPARATPSSSPS